MSPRKTVKRIVRKRRAVPLLKRPAAWKTAAAAVVAGGIAWTVLFLPALQIRHVRVEGARRADSAEIQAAAASAAVTRAAGLESKSMLFAGKERIAHAVLARFPAVKSVRVSRLVKTATLLVSVQERTETARWCGEGACLALDREGEAFAPAQNESLLAIRGGGNPGIGKRPLSPEMFSRAISFASRISAAGEGEQAELLALRSDALAVFRSSGGWEAFVNLAEPISWQAEKLETVLRSDASSDSRANLEYIDVRFGDQAYIKFREE